MKMEGYKPASQEEIEPTESNKAEDWNAIIRNSFAFSQGLYTLQTPITRWLAMGPLYDKYVDHSARESAKQHIKKYTEALTKDARHHSSTTADGSPITSYTSEAEKVLNNFEYELDSAFTVSDEERESQKRAALGVIADGLINRDTTYLLEREGRPISNDSKRDKWSSFIIDFGLFHKGDGFYTWNSTSDEFKQLWEEVMPVLRSRRPDELKAIADKYIQMHPDLTEEEILQIKSL